MSKIVTHVNWSQKSDSRKDKPFPKTYSILTNDVIKKILGSDALFLRKISQKCKLPSYFDNYDFSHSELKGLPKHNDHLLNEGVLQRCKTPRRNKPIYRGVKELASNKTEVLPSHERTTRERLVKKHTDICLGVGNKTKILPRRERPRRERLVKTQNTQTNPIYLEVKELSNKTKLSRRRERPRLLHNQIDS